MVRLKNRSESIPGGFQWVQAETNFVAPGNLSFNSVVDAVRRHRLGNSWLVKKHGWNTDWESIANEVDTANAMRMKANPKWSHFIISDDAGGSSLQIPFRQRLSAAGAVAGNVTKTVAGVKTLLSWLGSGGKPVAKELAESRASTCIQCSKNQDGSLSTWFTELAAAEILKVFGMMNDLKLSTSQDARLGVCSACLCPLKSKVHAPLAHIVAEMKPEIKAALNQENPKCWVLSEQ